ncbi:MAG: DUF481 domain-containing protein [Vicinamibacterales bacterium]
MTHLRRILVSAMVMAVLAVARLAGAQEDGDAAGGAQSEIRAKEMALADAMHRRDKAGLERLLAPEYVLRNAPDVDRATWIRNALTLCWGTRLDMDRFRTQQHDGVVVATFEMTFYQDPATCRPAVLRSEITDVWVEHPDGWQLLVRHSSPPPAPDSGVVSQYGIVPAPPPTWDISSEVSFVATSGNSATRTTGIGTDVTHRSGHASTRASGSYLSSVADGLTKARSLSVRGRHGFEFSQRAQVFGEGTYARDQFAGIDGRTTATLGLGYSPSTTPRHRLTLEAGFGITAEQRVGLDVRFASASGAAHYVWTIAPGTRLTEDATFSADLDSGVNWQQTGLTAISVTLSRLLSLKASNWIEYRNAPVAGFRRTDIRTSAALVLSLQRRPSAR